MNCSTNLHFKISFLILFIGSTYSHTIIFTEIFQKVSNYPRYTAKKYYQVFLKFSIAPVWKTFGNIISQLIAAQFQFILTSDIISGHGFLYIKKESRL